MNTEFEQIWWWNRWESVHDQICKTMEIANEPFKLLLGELLDFGESQFIYFYCGFGGNIPKGSQKKYVQRLARKRNFQLLAVDYEYPPDHVLRITLDQIVYDYLLIKHAWQQRFSPQIEISEGDTRESAEKRCDAQSGVSESVTLELADKWGEKLLENVVGKGDYKLLSSMPIIISYFSIAPNIRLVPYADVAIIGIPLTAMVDGDDSDLLMIGHELAHYIYWNGKIKGKPLRDLLTRIVRGEMPYAQQWIEELFADVIGLVLGNQPAVLPAAIRMIKDNLPANYVQDNRIHPLDAIRIHILIETILLIDKKIGDDSDKDQSEISDALTYLAQIDALTTSAGGYDSFLTVDRIGRSVNVKLSDVRKTLTSIISKIDGQIGLVDYYDLESWGKMITELKNIYSLTFKMPKADLKPEFPFTSIGFFKILQDYFPEIVFTDWNNEFQKTLIDLPVGEKESEVNNSKPQNCEEEKIKEQDPGFIMLRKHFFKDIYLESKIWKTVFAADGWALKGPEVGPTGDWESSGDRNSFY